MPVLEIGYLAKVVGLELIVTWTLYFGQKADTSINKQESDLWDSLYVLLGYTQVVVMGLINVPHPVVYQGLAKECYDQGHFIDVSSELNSGDGKRFLKWLLGSLCLVIVVPFTIAMLAQIPTVKKTWNRMVIGWEFPGWVVPGWLKKWDINDVNKILDVLTAVVFAFITVWNLRIIGTGRIMVLRTVGGENGHHRDCSWDYGQILAILVWYPVPWKAFTMISMC